MASPYALAEKAPSVVLDMSGYKEEVVLIKVNNVWTLMLPSGIKLSSIYAGKGVVLPDLKDDQIGEDQRISFSYNGKQTKLMIIPSENIGSTFIWLDRMKLAQFGDNKKRSDTGYLRVYDSQAHLDNEGELTKFSLHGNSTLKAKKKSFNLKLKEKKGLLSMDRDKSWALISNAYDNSFARNYIALTLAELLGMPFVPDQRPVDVYVNGEYLGAYLLTEKVQVGKGRVAIHDLEKATENLNERPLESYKQVGPKTPVKGKGKYYEIPNNPADITGGYLMELDLEARYQQLTSAYVTERGQIISIRSPKYMSKEQYEYISSLLQSMENAMYSEDGIDPITGRGFDEIVDLDSAVLKYMFEELLCNFDANKSSQFFYKDIDSVDSRIRFGPPWDYDISLANRSGEDGIQFIDPEALTIGVQIRMKLPVYYRQIYQLPQVQARLSSLFREAGIREAVEKLTKGKQKDVLTIDEWSALTETALKKNYMVNPNRFFAFYTRAYGNNTRLHAESVRDFLYKRMEYLEKIWTAPNK